jgi:L-threonylcarbamoyladenylate synthase
MPQSTVRRLVVDLHSPDPEVIERAVDVLLDGGVVAIPTETVYGLAADASRPEAVRKLYEVKNRSIEKAIPLLIHNPEQLRSVAADMPKDIEELARRYWPGPLTMVVKKYPGSFGIAAPGDTIGVRMPRHSIALAILAMIGRPLAVSSANLAGSASARSADDIERIFDEKVDLIIDSGPSGDMTESTVLDVTSTPYKILREGAISRQELTEVLGEKLSAVQL